MDMLVQRQRKMNIPRIMIAAPKSGSGKTLITCALLGALKRAGKDVAAVKCGPDYIDPMFHRTVLKIPSENLDTFFSGEDGTVRLFSEVAAGHEIVVMEGVMGLFDGLGGVREEGSAYHLAAVTKTPVILCVDVHGMGRSMIPLIKGFLDYDKEKLIKGVILNRISESFYEIIKPHIEKETGIRVMGFFPTRKDIRLESRHLGLRLPGEIEDLNTQLEAAAKQFEKSVGLAAVFETAQKAETLEVPEKKELMGRTVPTDGNLTLAVARDEAFCFYYGANIRMFRELGVKIEYFSPLHDEKLPDDISGILFGGGYPELYAKRLSENSSMTAAVRQALKNNTPSLAECGGFMYLHESITDMNGETWPLIGAVRGSVSYQGKLVRFGYVEINEHEPLLLDKGGRIRAHEFHYYDSSDNGSCCTATKITTGKHWECVHESKHHFWGFAHLYYPSAPEFVINFVKAMYEFSENAGNTNK